MIIGVRISPGVTVVTLRGEFHIHTRREFTAAVDAALAAPCAQLLINLEAISSLDSAALGLLAIAHQKCYAQRTRLSVLKPQPFVEQVLRIAHLDTLIPIYASEGAALAAPGPDRPSTLRTGSGGPA